MSLVLEGASEVVLSFEDDSFLRRYFLFAGGSGASTEIRFCGISPPLSFILAGFSEGSFSFVTSSGREEGGMGGVVEEGGGIGGAVEDVGVEMDGFLRLCTTL